MEAVNFPFAIDEETTTDNGLVKFAFHYQLHDRIQWGNMLCIVIAAVFTWGMRMYDSVDLRLCAVVLIVLSALLLAAFSLIQNLKIFRAVGYCWREGEHVVIRCGESEYRISSVKEMIGGNTRFFFSECSVLSITTDRDIFEIHSLPLTSDKQFEDSSVFPLCQFVLRNFPYLQAVQLPGQKTKHRYVRIDQ